MSCHDLTREQMRMLLDDVRSWPEVMSVEANKSLTYVTVTFWPRTLGPSYSRVSVLPPTRYVVDFSKPEPNGEHWSQQWGSLDPWAPYVVLMDNWDGKTHYMGYEFEDVKHGDMWLICDDPDPLLNTNPHQFFYKLLQWHMNGGVRNLHLAQQWWQTPDASEFLSQEGNKIIYGRTVVPLKATDIQKGTYVGVS